MKKINFLLATFGLLLSTNLRSQVASYTSSQLYISDAVGTAMAGTGIASEADVYSQNWNPAKYVFMDDKGGISGSYNHFIQNIVGDNIGGNVTGYYKLGKNAISSSFDYYCLGDVYLSDMEDHIVRPNDYSIDLSYSRKITNNISGALTVRFLSSKNFSVDYYEFSRANTFGIDLAFYGCHPIQIGNVPSHVTWGATIKNFGGKLKFDGDDNAEFNCGSWRIGAGLQMQLADQHKLGLYVGVDEYLLPQYPVQGEKERDEDYDDRVLREYYDLSGAKGFFKGFGNLPIGVAFAAEYNFLHNYFFRTGYHYYNSDYNYYTGFCRPYYSSGAGVKFKYVDVDISYQRTFFKKNFKKHGIMISAAVKLP